MLETHYIHQEHNKDY